MGWPSGITWMQPGNIPSETISEAPEAKSREPWSRQPTRAESAVTE
jgi:hypothetical protein